ncbi:MAG: hypothetical protein M3070_13680 [Actinomycetota bacterium]|nr:hypothetical protein [Actinomycetota bacterium]
MESSDERDDNDRDDSQAADVARYEQLRRRALAGEADGWRAGLAVLQHHGVAAWLRAWLTVSAPASPPAPTRASPPPVDISAADRLVQALASMALGAVAAR